MLVEFIRFSTLFGSTKVLVIPVPIRYWSNKYDLNLAADAVARL